MSFLLLNGRFGTLRWRLAAWNTIVLAALLLAALLAVRAGLRVILSHMVDEFLGEELVAAARDVDRLAPDWQAVHDSLDRRASGHPRRLLFVQVFASGGAPLWSSTHTPAEALEPPDPARTGILLSNHSYRLLHQRLATAEGPALSLRVGCSVRRADLEMNRFTRLLLVTGGLLLLLSPLGGYLLAGRATRPLAAIIATTDRLHPGHLRERLPVRGTSDELDRLSATINGFLDRIARHIEQIREFTANAAHELRSPLTALYSSLEVSLNEERSPEEYQDILSDMLDECGRLRLLVNQLLLLAEGDAGRLCAGRDPVRLDDLVRRSAEMFQAVAEAGGVELQVERVEPVVVPGDGAHLWRVVNNLLENALKFTPIGGRIDVVLAEERPGTVMLRVADTGVGIPAEHLPHVLERFYRVDRGRTRQGPARGNGLGLSICQAVVAAHGGTITLASVPGQGTEAVVRLPGGPAPLPAGETPCVPVERPTRMGERRRQTSSFSTTRPPTSVRRKSRPWARYVSRR